MKTKVSIFTKIFFSLVFTALIVFFFTNSKSKENSYQNYFSKLLGNFSESVQTVLAYETIESWFSPEVKADEQEKFTQYKLTILSKSVGQYFKNLLSDTQNDILSQELKRSLGSSGRELATSREVLRKYIQKKKDVKEISIFSLEGKKLIGLRYQNVPDYIVTENLIIELKNKENLLLKHGKTSFLILLTLVKDQDEPFMIISQTLHPSFFDRILSHLEMNDELFYLKDSHNYVLLDNYPSYKYEQEKKSSRPYDLYQALVDVDERNLSIRFEDVDYSIGVIVEKNNVWGNLFATIFFIMIFSVSFIVVDWIFVLIKGYSFASARKWKELRNESENEDASVATAKATTSSAAGLAGLAEADGSGVGTAEEETDYPSFDDEPLYGNSDDSDEITFPGLTHLKSQPTETHTMAKEIASVQDSGLSYEKYNRRSEDY